MFPIRDENPHFLTPWVTYAIIGLNTAAWALIQSFGWEPALAKSVCTLGLIPGDLLNTLAPGTRFQIGPNAWCVLSGTAPFYTIITSMFLPPSNGTSTVITLVPSIRWD